MLKRNIRIVVMLSDKEKEKLDKFKKKSGLNLSNFVRCCCLSNTNITFVDRKLLGQIKTEINYIGHNINQIAYLANANKNISMDEIKRVYALLETLRIEMKKHLGY